MSAAAQAAGPAGPASSSLKRSVEMYRSEVDGSYQGWRDHASKGDSFGLIRRSDAWYKGLWKE